MPSHHPGKPKPPKKPKKPKKARKPHGRRKPNPEHARRKRGKKPQKPFHKHPHGRRSGSIPRPCRKLRAIPSLLDCWLNHNPDVANAILWEPAPDVSADPIAWPDWTGAMKAELREAWMHARAWRDAGMTHYAGTLVEDPPPNQDVAVEGAPFFRTVLDGPTQAWPLYLANVAQSLAAEIDAWVPWSLRGAPPEMLEHLLSGVRMFRRDTGDGGANDAVHPGGYVLGGASAMETCTPSHPTFTYRFLVQNDLIGDTRRNTVVRVVDWCRWNLAHYFGTFSPQNAEYHWQYRGAPPVRRIVDGTLITDPALSGAFPTPKHWTRGCGGTCGFLRSILRAVNIPVTLKWRCGHTLPYFHGADRYLSHGDDPYSSIAKVDYPADLLLVDETTFDAWFPFDPAASAAQKAADEATSCAHIGRRVIDLAVWHIGDAMVFKYCQDKAAGVGHADGQVYAVFAPHGYTVAQLEATQLWERLAAEAALQGAC